MPGEVDKRRRRAARRGYASLEAVCAEAEAEGEVTALRASILEVFAARGLEVGGDVHAALAEAEDPALLRRWLREAVTAAASSDIFGS